MKSKVDQCFKICFILFLISSCAHNNVKNSPAKNVILITSSSLSINYLKSYVLRKSNNENIENFFKDGLIFNSHFTNSRWPFQALVSLNTGLKVEEHEVLLNYFHNEKLYSGNNFNFDKIDLKSKTISEHFKNLGYETFFMGGKPHQAIYSKEIGYGRGVDKFVNRSLEDFKDIDEIIDFINKSKQPFFLNINSVITHFPHFFLSSSRKLKNDNYKGILPKNREEYDLLLNNCFVELKKSCPIDFSQLPKEFISKNKYSMNEHKIITYLMYEKKREDLLFLEEIYSEAVVYLDRLLGKLFDFLKSSKFMENTIVVLTSDVGQTISEGLNLENGESEFNYGYSLNNEEVLKIPLMVYLPERHLNEAGKLYIEEKTSTIDLLPSILFTLGYKLEEDTSGLRIDFNNPHIPYRQFISGLSFRPHRGLEFYNISNKYIMFSSSNKSGVYNRYSGKTKFDLSFIQDLDLNSQKEELAKYQKSLPESFLKKVKEYQEFKNED